MSNTGEPKSCLLIIDDEPAIISLHTHLLHETASREMRKRGSPFIRTRSTKCL